MQFCSLVAHIDGFDRCGLDSVTTFVHSGPALGRSLLAVHRCATRDSNQRARQQQGAQVVYAPKKHVYGEYQRHIERLRWAHLDADPLTQTAEVLALPLGAAGHG
jgi:hypothetical protein